MLLLCPLTFEKYWITRLVSLSVIKQLLNLQLTYWIFFSNVVEHLQCIFFLFFFTAFAWEVKLLDLQLKYSFFHCCGQLFCYLQSPSELLSIKCLVQLWSNMCLDDTASELYCVIPFILGIC